MTYNYSKDLRELVVRKVLSGMSKQSASETYDVHRTTISKWVKQYRKDGSLEPSARRSYRNKRMSDEDLLFYLKKRSDATLEEIAGHFNYKIPSIFYRLKKLGITRKKNHVVF